MKTVRVKPGVFDADAATRKAMRRLSPRRPKPPTPDAARLAEKSVKVCRFIDGNWSVLVEPRPLADLSFTKKGAERFANGLIEAVAREIRRALRPSPSRRKERKSN